MTHKLLNSAVLSDNSSSSPEFGYVGNGLCRQTFEVLVGRLEDVDHRLQTTQLCDRLADLHIPRDFLQDL